MSECWLTQDEAVSTIRERIAGSVGLSEARLKVARASGEVRTQEPLVMNDDGVVGMRNRVIGERLFNGEDLQDWLDRNHPAAATPSSRYPSDAALIAEGRRMVATGMEKRAVARKLAERAEGAGTFDSKVDRLRRAL